MKLEASYAAMTDVPSGFEGSYTEEDGKAVFTGGEFKSEAEYNEVLKAKKAGFDQLHETKEKLKAFDGIDVKKFKDTMDEVELLRAKAKDGGASDEETIKMLVDAKVKRATEELTKQNGELTEQLATANGSILKNEKQTLLSEVLGKNVSKDALSDASFIIGSAVERQADGSYMSNGQAGFEQGLSIEQVVAKAVESRPHWQKKSTPGHGSGGAGGAGIKNKPRFDQLMEKDNLTRAEANELDTLAAEIKAEQN